MAVLGRLGAEAAAWREAWRNRRDNPVALSAALQFARSSQRRPVWLPCSRFMFACAVLISGATAYLLVVAWQRFTAVSGSSVVTRGFARNALGWGGVQVLEGAQLLALLWLAERLVLALWYAGGLLATYPGARGALSPELAGSRLSDHECVTGALVYIARLCWTPMLVLGVLNTLDQFIYASGWLPLPGGPGAAYSAEHLPWLALIALLSIVLKPLCGMLAVWAGALLLLSFGPWWRHAAVSYGAAALALLWHAPGLACALPGTAGQQLAGMLGYSLWWSEFAPSLVLLLIVLLLLLAAEAHATSPLGAYSFGARRQAPALRLVLATGAVAVLLGGLVNLCAYLVNEPYVWGDDDLPTTLSLALWPAMAVSVACPLSLTALVADYGHSATPAGAYLGLSLRAVVQLGVPLGLALIFAGHARAALYVRRSVLG